MYGKGSFLLPLLASAALASTPSEQCRGSCTVVHPGSDTQVPSRIRIDGPSHAVSDLTEASGWEVLNCPSDWSKGFVDIRLVCTDKNPEASCHHIHEQGAEHTIVMLPLDCGTGPFARVARWQLADDQSIPAGSAAEHKIRRRGLSPEVIEARLDYDFRAIPQSRGLISFDIVGSHHPEINDEIKDGKSVPHVLRRALSSDVEAAAHHVAAVPTATNDLFGISIPSVTLPHVTIPHVTLPHVTLPDIPSISVPSISVPSISIPSISVPHITVPHITLPDLPSITSLPLPDLGAIKSGIVKSKGFEAVNVKKNITLINESLGCQFGTIGFDQSATVTVDTDTVINAAYAFKIAGTISPPDVTDFALAGALSGRINATLDIDMYLSADILLPPLQIIGFGVPGLSFPGLFAIGPEAVLKATIDLSVDVAFAANIPMLYDFDRIDFVLPEELAPSGSSGSSSHKQSAMQMNVSPGDQTGSVGFHLIPRLQFGLDILNGWADAAAYVGIDADITFNSNGTIYPDFSYDGCQDISIGAEANVGVTASAIKFLHVGKNIPLYSKRDVLWQHCSKAGDGPTTAILDNGDGTYTNANGDLVNVNGQLIDDEGNVIPDDDAEDLPPPPVKDDQGKDIPEEDLILDNLDNTFEDAWGNATNSVGQKISFDGTIMGCELDATNVTDTDGKPLAAEDMIVDAGEGIFSNSKCQLVNEDGSLVDELGNIIDFEPFLDDDGSEIHPSNVTIDNEDGTFSDPFGNPVDLWGNAIDLNDDGEVIQVPLTPDTDDDSQEDADQVDGQDPTFSIMSPDQLKTLVENLIHGTAPSGGTTATPGSTTAPPPTESAPTTSTPPTTNSPPATSAPATSSDSAPASSVPATSESVPATSVPATSESIPATSAPATETTVQPPTTAVTPPAAPTGSCKAPGAAKRSLATPKNAKRAVSSRAATPNHVSHSLRRKRAILGKRSGFGCTLPSIGGLPLPHITGIDDLVALF